VRLSKLSFRGITSFQSATPVVIDFDELGSGLIALVGRNGAGKTTACEATPVALFKSFPSRPGFYENFSGRDAFVEAIFDDDGHELKVRLQVDAAHRRTESYLFIDGVSLTTGRAAEFEFAIAAHFGSYQLFLSSVFASQTKSGSFLGMKKSDRKDLFVELLGLGALQVLAETARERGTSADVHLDRHRLTLTAAEQEAAGLEVAECELIGAEAAADAAAIAIDRARTEEAAAIAAHERAKGAGERIATLAAAERTARAAYVEAEKATAVAGRGPKAARDRKEERLRAISARKADELEPLARRRHADGVAALGRRQAALEAQLRDVPDAEAEMAKVADLERRRAALVGMIGVANVADNNCHLARVRFEAADHALAVDRKRLADERGRLTKQAERLGQVPCTGPVPDIAAACPLLADARLAAGRLAGLEEPDDAVWLAARTAYAEAKAAVRPVDEFEDPSTYDVAIKTAIDAIARAEAAGHARAALEALEGEREALDLRTENDIVVASAAMATAAENRKTAEEQYEAELMEADEACQDAGAAMKRASEALAEATMALEVAKRDAGDVAGAERAHAIAEVNRKGAEATQRGADQDRATAQARVDALRQKAARLPDLQAAVQLAEQELGDWNLLTKSLGRDGVQALEIDAAGPEVATLTNDLLAACYGPRFSITFETLATKRDGGQKEVFDVRVYDGAAERPVEALSGGEKVVVGEAIGLAIAIFNARKSGIRYETLWRDETAGALDTTNAAAYVAMLRRARVLGGFSQVLFVAHQPEVFEAADARLIVAGGTIVAEHDRAAA
jgi:exonuclease SbcC